MATLCATRAVADMKSTMETLSKILPAIAARATALDRGGQWPQDDLNDLAAVGAWRWFVPAEFGGEEVDPLELHLRYEAIASASLATALVFSQRDSAVGLIGGSDGSPLRAEILPKMASGEWFGTIGIAQLTTSRQGGMPALRATKIGSGYRLDGTIPWATGAGKSRFIVAGAVLDDGDQILFLLPTDLAGVTIQPPLPLVALSASWTTQVDCRGVELEEKCVLRGPVPKALSGRSRGLPIGQAFLALGLCRGGLELIGGHDSDRGRNLRERLGESLAAVRAEVLEICRPGWRGAAAEQIPRVRAACNDLAMRMTQSAVALYKGSALLADHPAQRLAREAMFLLVWSCPDPVIDCTVNTLAERDA